MNRSLDGLSSSLFFQFDMFCLSSPLQGKEATVEPWEDTNFHLYKVVDRFGFVQ